jgi:hypothetical protein
MGKGREVRAHTVLRNNPMKAAPEVSRTSATADPDISMFRVRVYAAEKIRRGVLGKTRSTCTDVLYLRTWHSIPKWIRGAAAWH